jgi:hypothetical protein
MAVTHRARKRAVPYRTRLTGRLISLRESVFDEVEFRFASRKRALLNEGFGATRRTPRQFWLRAVSAMVRFADSDIGIGQGSAYRKNTVRETVSCDNK